jgi:pSer/pThr/pTyr-binding forkhead associated (FHA) protein
MYGELVPQGGGDPIPLLRESLMVGRRESCDIVLRFPNVSAHHCQMDLKGGYWYVQDLKSRNGTKVNGIRITQKRVSPGDVLSFASHNYDVKYSPTEIGAVGPPPEDGLDYDVFDESLLQRAGLEKSRATDSQVSRQPKGSAGCEDNDDPPGPPGHVRPP